MKSIGGRQSQALAPKAASAAGDTNVLSFCLAKPLYHATQALPRTAACFKPRHSKANGRNFGGPHVPK
jgi:hypothetical protein